MRAAGRKRPGAGRRAGRRRLRAAIAAIVPTVAIATTLSAVAVAAARTTSPVRGSSASHHASLFLATHLGAYEMMVMAGSQLTAGPGSPSSAAPNLIVSLIRPHAGPGSEVDSYMFHLGGAFLTIRGSFARLSTGRQLGAFGSIELSLHATSAGRGVPGCGVTLASGRGGLARGSLRFVPGGSYFGTISRGRMPGALISTSFSSALARCRGVHLTTTAPPEPSVCPHSPPLLVMGSGGTSPGGGPPEGFSGTATSLFATDGEGHAMVTVMRMEPKARAISVLHMLLFRSLPPGAFSAAGTSATLSPSTASPFLSGYLSFSGQAYPEPQLSCLSFGAGSGDLTAHFDSIGAVSLGSLQGFLAE